MLALVSAGVGISLVPRRTATALHRSGVVYRAVVDPAVVILAAAHRPDPGLAVQAVLAACRATSPDGSDTAEPLGPGST
jgi:DNA-binding transcriptional LysR family regulator